jgi:hypothetical protein
MTRRLALTPAVHRPSTSENQSPALAQWRRELQAGVRTSTDFDALWRAACFEIEAEEADSAGLHVLAASKRASAHGHVLVAKKQEA